MEFKFPCGIYFFTQAGKYKEKTRENLSCYVKICYNYSNRGFVKGEVGDGRI